MIKLYISDIRNLQDPKDHLEMLEDLPKARKEKILCFKLPSGRKQSLGAGLLLKKVLSDYGISQEKLKIGKNGKPEAEGIQFNLSHTDGLAVCAVGKLPVGCDVEKIKKAPEKIAERYFTENEAAYLKKCSADVYNEEFFRFWTTKEAYMKMTGEGLSLGLDQFEVRLDGPHISIYKDGKLENCYIKEYEIPGYKVTVCARENEFDERMLELVLCQERH